MRPEAEIPSKLLNCSFLSPTVQAVELRLSKFNIAVGGCGVSPHSGVTQRVMLGPPARPYRILQVAEYRAGPKSCSTRDCVWRFHWDRTHSWTGKPVLDWFAVPMIRVPIWESRAVSDKTNLLLTMGAFERRNYGCETKLEVTEKLSPLLHKYTWDWQVSTKIGNFKLDSTPRACYSCNDYMNAHLPTNERCEFYGVHGNAYIAWRGLDVLGHALLFRVKNGGHILKERTKRLRHEVLEYFQDSEPKLPRQRQRKDSFTEIMNLIPSPPPGTIHDFEEPQTPPLLHTRQTVEWEVRAEAGTGTIVDMDRTQTPNVRSESDSRTVWQSCWHLAASFLRLILS